MLILVLLELNQVLKGMGSNSVNRKWIKEITCTGAGKVAAACRIDRGRRKSKANYLQEARGRDKMEDSACAAKSQMAYGV